MKPDETDKAIPEAQWLRFNEATNALDYLRRASVFAREAESDIIAWKWVAIALHGALYSFAVVAARGSDSRSVLKGEDKLLGFWKVLKRCQDPNHMRMSVQSKHLEMSEGENESIEFLTTILRNEFSHFKPQFLSIEIHGMPQIAIDALRIIGFLALETKTHTDLDEVQKQEVKTLIQETSSYLKDTNLYKELRQLLR